MSDNVRNEETQRLLDWMAGQGFSVRKLAAETGMSYDGMYQILHARRRVSPGFKVRFIDRFGKEVADTIFDSPLAAQEPVHV